jgi:hypothetical protein
VNAIEQETRMFDNETAFGLSVYGIRSDWQGHIFLGEIA